MAVGPRAHQLGGATSSGARVWTLSTALAEPIRVTLPRRPWRARCPPGRRHVPQHRRGRSDAPWCVLRGGRDWRRSQRLSRGRQNRRRGGDRASGEGPPPIPLRRCWRGLQSWSRYSGGVTRDRRAGSQSDSDSAGDGWQGPIRRASKAWVVILQANAPGCGSRWTQSFRGAGPDLRGLGTSITSRPESQLWLRFLPASPPRFCRRAAN